MERLLLLLWLLLCIPTFKGTYCTTTHCISSECVDAAHVMSVDIFWHPYCWAALKGVCCLDQLIRNCPNWKDIKKIHHFHVCRQLKPSTYGLQLQGQKHFSSIKAAVLHKPLNQCLTPHIQGIPSALLIQLRSIWLGNIERILPYKSVF